MATKMAGRLTVQERAQIAARYEVWNLVVAVQRWRRYSHLKRSVMLTHDKDLVGSPSAVTASDY
ncbi:hypothetical protein L798_01352 [Zootermopsis nevadensis]|uniref:Uncharacterized protein n=1 Tax=Zootermopsis nevadensis TaxID=136037 RepID=A0A067QTX3_ZOONE|nr:hypothetical protein L798_01352 [Zootermopsis nevadensis]